MASELSAYLKHGLFSLSTNNKQIYYIYKKHEAYSALFNDDDDDEAAEPTHRGLYSYRRGKSIFVTRSQVCLYR